MSSRKHQAVTTVKSTRTQHLSSMVDGVVPVEPQQLGAGKAAALGLHWLLCAPHVPPSILDCSIDRPLKAQQSDGNATNG